MSDTVFSFIKEKIKIAPIIEGIEASKNKFLYPNNPKNNRQVTMPQTAPKLSIVRINPKFPPLLSFVETSAIMASLGALLIFPARSNILKGIR